MWRSRRAGYDTPCLHERLLMLRLPLYYMREGGRRMRLCVCRAVREQPHERLDGARLVERVRVLAVVHLRDRLQSGRGVLLHLVVGLFYPLHHLTYQGG